MSEFSAYMWSVPDWRTDEMYLYLDNREQGIYRNLIDECWVSGSIVSDLDLLARFVHEPLDYFLTVWPKIHKKFRLVSNGSRYISARLEKDRGRLMHNAKFNQHRARKAAEARWNKTRVERELHATSTIVATSEHAFEHSQSKYKEETSSSFPDTANTKESPIPIVSTPPAEKRGGRPDPAAELFRAAYQEHIGNPYGWLAGDFPQLAKLRKRLGLSPPTTPDHWEAALLNYFASPFAEFSLQHFAAKFDTFRNSQLDRFKTPVNHANGGNGSGQSRPDFNKQEAQRLRAQLDSQDSGGGERRHSSAHPGGVSGAARKVES